MLDNKQLKIIDTIIQDPVVTRDRLVEKLGLTYRQVDYSIDKLNQYLVSNKQKRIDMDGAYAVIPTQVYEYLLKLRASESLTSLHQYTLSGEERQIFLSLLLACHDSYLSLVHLQDYMQVSQSTISKDLKNLELHLKKFNLNIHYDRISGYKLAGQESYIRSFMIRTISSELFANDSNLLNTCAKYIQHIDVQKMLQSISKLAVALNIKFIENRMLEFVYIMSFMVSRLRINPEYSPNANIEVEKTVEFMFSKKLLEDLEIDGSYDNVKYLTTITLCLSVGSVENFQLDRKIFSIVKEFVQIFSNISGIAFRDINKVTEQMFTHFRSMYYRLQFDYPIINPLTDQVSKEYSEIFTLVIRSIGFLKKNLGSVPKEEIAFLTIHLISFVYATDSKKNDNIRAAIVCPNGIGSSALAYLQLTNLFPNIKFLKPFRFSDLDEHLSEIDLIFSTFYRSQLFAQDKPCFIVNPIMTGKERYALVQRVNSELSLSTSLDITALESIMSIVSRTVKDLKKQNKIRHDLETDLFKTQERKQESKLRLSDVLNEKYIQSNMNVNSVQDAVEAAAEPLLRSGVISMEYLDAIVSQQSLASYQIAPCVLLPHANPKKGANQVGISIVSLKKPIKFSIESQKRVKYIFFLSAVNSTDHLTVLQDLLNLLKNGKFKKMLDDSNESAQNILQYIQAEEK